MKRFILTGAPGAGKTVVLRELERDGFSVVEEAATDVIALARGRGVNQPEGSSGFIDDIVRLQNQRLARSSAWPDALQFHDRSAVCTAALAAFLGYPVSDELERALARIAAEATYQQDVFFIQNLGFIENTAARRINFKDTLRFEAVHLDLYRRLGYRLVVIAPGPPSERAATIKALATAIV